MTLEQQVASLVTATTDLTTVVNTELNNVRQENTNFKNGIVDSQGQGVFNGIKIGRGAGNVFGNLAVGENALTSNSNIQNTAIGTDALKNNTTGYANTALGCSSLQNSISGIANTGLGFASLTGLTTGWWNTAIGTNTLTTLTTGTANVAVGMESCLGLNGSYNVAIGMSTLRIANCSESTAIGHSSQYQCTSGSKNTSIGVGSLYYNTTGENNSAIGTSALLSVVSYNNSTGLGYQADVSGSNQVQLGNSLTTTYVFGTVQNRSDIRDKTDVRNTILGLDFIKSLRPVDYRWDIREDYKPVAPQDPGIEATEEQKASYQAQIKTWLEACKLKNIVHNGTKKRNRFHHGLIAQEVKAVLTQKGIDFGGYQDHSISGGDDVLSLGYDQFIAPLIKAVQELSAQNEALIARISALESNLK
jgi:hypothetical protein